MVQSARPQGPARATHGVGSALFWRASRRTNACACRAALRLYMSIVPLLYARSLRDPCCVLTTVYERRMLNAASVPRRSSYSECYLGTRP